ncbi:MAG: hypothetical protein HYX41_06760 [Bdellovibrio sp.]|nr:hypothetical protein [Bdellovibrio sp.]
MFNKAGRSGLFILFLPLVAAIFVWSSVLSFVPVPWPDDSAFYFVAKDFFRWPPRWVMLPQAPFEPSYAVFNFNTMPLYPILIGLGRFIGIDSSHLLKIWPLSAWALSGALMGFALLKKGLRGLPVFLVLLFFATNPILRWASVLVRPESLVGLFGLALILGLTFEFPKRLRPKGLWDPVAALLALAAFAHFNSIHLVMPVFSALFFQPKRLLQIVPRTLLYLSPWLLCVLLQPSLFIKQMALQWTRLAIRNNWLDKPSGFWTGLFDSMGSPEPWSPLLYWSSPILWGLIFSSFLLVVLSFYWMTRNKKDRPAKNSALNSVMQKLLPSAVWVLSAVWLWHSKPEVWFKYYIHLSLGCFLGVSGWLLWQKQSELFKTLQKGWIGVLVLLCGIFLTENWTQWHSLSQSKSWSWATYANFVECIDRRLTLYEKESGIKSGLQVWFPTFPDVTIEISKKHPNWKFSRTNDFWERQNLAIQHGKSSDAVVVTETLGNYELDLEGPLNTFPIARSLWMEWKGYFLHELWRTPHWKPNRYLCQKGKWQAFIYLENGPSPGSF